MTKLEEFVSFASELPRQRREEIETLLSSIMMADNQAFSMSSEHEAEISRRLNNPKPSYASTSEVEAVFGRQIRS